MESDHTTHAQLSEAKADPICPVIVPEVPPCLTLGEAHVPALSTGDALHAGEPVPVVKSTVDIPPLGDEELCEEDADDNECTETPRPEAPKIENRSDVARRVRPFDPPQPRTHDHRVNDKVWFTPHAHGDNNSDTPERRLAGIVLETFFLAEVTTNEDRVKSRIYCGQATGEHRIPKGTQFTSCSPVWCPPGSTLSYDNTCNGSLAAEFQDVFADSGAQWVWDATTVPSTVGKCTPYYRIVENAGSVSEKGALHGEIYGAVAQDYVASRD